jgi:hypothetical protein
VLVYVVVGAGWDVALQVGEGLHYAGFPTVNKGGVWRGDERPEGWLRCGSVPSRLGRLSGVRKVRTGARPRCPHTRSRPCALEVRADVVLEALGWTIVSSNTVNYCGFFQEYSRMQKQCIRGRGLIV